MTIDQSYGTRDSLNRMPSRVLKRNTTPFSTEAYTYDRMNRLAAVARDSLADSFNYYWTGELLSAHYGGQPDMPYTEEQDPDLDTTDNVDPWAGDQPPETEEAEPPPPADDTTPSDSTPDTTPSPDFTPPSDTPPAEDPAKEQKTVEDYVGDSNLGPEGPQPDLPTRNVTYTLDKAGNRTSVTDNANGNATYAPNNLNQYTSVGGSSVINGGEHEIQTYNNVGYTYINDERLTTVKTPPTNPTYTYNLYYDALGRCVKRTLNGMTTYYIYDGEKPILEYRSGDLSNPAKNVYGKGIDEILMRYDPTLTQNQTFYYQQDHEGSVTHLLNTSGNVIETYNYDAFGAPTIYAANGTQRSSSAYSNRFLFTGREYANLFGFYEYRARAYHPTLGRFMSEDPKLFDAGDYNLFRYCHNDPLDLTDPMGLEWDTSQLDAQEWQITRNYLMRSPTGRGIIMRGDKLPQKIAVVPNAGHKDSTSKQGPIKIDWDPHSAIRTPENGRQSPALGLLHEMDHAVRRATDPAGFKRDDAIRDRQYRTREERRVIDGSEARAAGELKSEDRRYSHNLDSRLDRYHTASPTSRDPVAPNASEVERQKKADEGIQRKNELMHGLDRRSP